MEQRQYFKSLTQELLKIENCVYSYAISNDINVVTESYGPRKHKMIKFIPCVVAILPMVKSVMWLKLDGGNYDVLLEGKKINKYVNVDRSKEYALNLNFTPLKRAENENVTKCKLFVLFVMEKGVELPSFESEELSRYFSKHIGREMRIRSLVDQYWTDEIPPNVCPVWVIDVNE